MKKLIFGWSLLMLILVPVGVYASIQPGFNTNYFNPTNTALNVASGAPADIYGRCDDCYLDTPLPVIGSGGLGFSENLNFEGFSLTHVYVNNNGNITFTKPLSTFTPFPIVQNGLPMIAPFFADVDTRGAPPVPPTGLNITAWGTGVYGGRPAWGVTWDLVGYFAAHEDLLNGFQLILVDRSDTDRHPGDGNFDIYFYYQQLLWNTGDASGGHGGRGGSSARAGLTNGGSFAYEFPGSGVDGALLDGGPDSLVDGSNMGVPGCYLFQVRDGQVGTTPEPTSLLMFGSGILGLAGVLRRKLAR